MASTTLPGGTFTLADDLTLTRIGYGAMQLAGPGVFGPSLLQRSPNILLIPGTSSALHLRDNVAGAALELAPDAIAELDGIAG